MRPGLAKVTNPALVTIPGQNQNTGAVWSWKGHSFPLHSYAQPYSLMIDQTLDVFRAEVRTGENAYFDARSPVTRERAEISWETPTFPWSTDLWSHGFLWVEPVVGTIGTGKEPIVFQWHDTGDVTDGPGMAPPVSLIFTAANTLLMQWAYNLQNPFVSGITANTVSLGTALPGRWHNVLMRTKMNADALNGEVDCWLNGVLAESSPGSGYTYRGNLGTPNILGPYWKAGIYRFTDTPNFGISWQGLTVSTSSLLARRDLVAPLVRY